MVCTDSPVEAYDFIGLTFSLSQLHGAIQIAFNQRNVAGQYIVAFNTRYFVIVKHF